MHTYYISAHLCKILENYQLFLTVGDYHNLKL